MNLSARHEGSDRLNSSTRRQPNFITCRSRSLILKIGSRRGVALAKIEVAAMRFNEDIIETSLWLLLIVIFDRTLFPIYEFV